MDEEKKKQTGLFRYSVISDFVNVKNLDWGEQERLLKEKCSRKWDIPYSEKTGISRSTILNWIKAWKDSNGDITSLYPGSRNDKGKSRALDEDTCLGLKILREEYPKATVPFLINEMKSRKMVTPGIELKDTTVYRFCNKNGLMKQSAYPEDRRRFEAELPNDLWQSDVMHGPKVENDKRLRKTYLIAIIDDHSRLIPHAQFYLSEALPLYLDTLEQAFAKRGLPRKLYVDNGPAFRSNHLEYVTASLNIALIHARPYKPQGKGKIERWFKTVRSSFLPGFKGNTLSELNEAVSLWIDNVYHCKRHSSTGQNPFERFTSNMECIRPAPEDLERHFRNRARRKVAKDRTITFKGYLYEAPVSLIGRQVEILYHENDLGAIEIISGGKSYGMVRQVDVHVNCKVKRDANNMRDVIITPDDTKYKSGKLIGG